MPDEQIESVLAEARQAFVISEVMRHFHTYQRVFERIAPQMDPEEWTAVLIVLRLALDRIEAKGHLSTVVLKVLTEYVRSDGLSHPPSVRMIARRLAVTRVAVEEAIGTLVERGHIAEMAPRGFIIRRRRFRFIPKGGDVIASTSPP